MIRPEELTAGPKKRLLLRALLLRDAGAAAAGL